MVLSQSQTLELNESQKAVLQKYVIDGETTWEEVARRVARFVASAEPTPELQRAWQERFLSILLPMKFMPGGSILANSDHGTRGLLNCFVLSAEDNIYDITKLVSDAVLTTKFRGGVGINIGSQGQKGYIRSKGAPFQDGMALGPCAVLDMVSENSKKITTGNKARRGAFLFSMDWRHEDIWEFIQAKTQSTIDAAIVKAIIEQMAQLVLSDCPDSEKRQQLRDLNHQLSTAWVETHLNPEGKRDRRWHNANISVQLDDEFFARLDQGDEQANQLWNQIAQYAHDTADPGLLLIDNAKRRSPIRDFVTCTNPCYAAGTMVLTRDGHYPIEMLLGKTVEVWDGERWCQINNFRVTGENQSVFEVTLSNGQSVKATLEHQFILTDGTRKRLADLEIGDRLMTHEIGVDGSTSVKGAYLKGFLTGNGCYDQRHDKPVLLLYEPKFCCAERLVQSSLEIQSGDIFTNCVEKIGFSTGEVRKQMTGLTARKYELSPWVKDYKDSFPMEALNWDLTSKLEFIAGVMDADGTASDTKNGFMYQVCSIHREWLKGFQLLLRTIGVKSKLTLMKKAEAKDFGLRGGGVYQTRNCYRLTVSQASSIKLSRQAKFSRLVSFANKSCRYELRGREATVSSIEFSHIADQVYCCTVPETHCFSLSNGLVTGQCGEIFLPPNSACNLGSIVVTKFVSRSSNNEIKIDWDGLAETVAIATRFLDDVLDVSEFATPDQKHNVRHVFRQLGLGIMGWADYLKLARIPYDSVEHLREIDQWGSWIAEHAYRASEAIAAEKGACGIWQQIKAVRTGNSFEQWVDSEGNHYNGVEALHSGRQDLEQIPRRNSTVLSIAPTGSIAQLSACSWAFEPDFGLTVWKQVFVDASKNQQNWVQILNPYLDELNLSESDSEIVKQTGSLKGTQFAKDHPEVVNSFKIATEIPPGWHILVQSKWQDWIDSSISKTINLPAQATVAEIKDIYRLAQKAGLKGVTIYRSGTLDSEPIKVGSEEKK